MVNFLEPCRYPIPTFTASEDWHNSDMDVVVEKGWEVTSQHIEELFSEYGMNTFHVVGAIIQVVEHPNGLHFVINWDRPKQQ